MEKFKSEFLNILQERELLYQVSNPQGLDNHLQTPQTAYIGFDCTAPSLHVGSLIQILLLKYFQQTGNKVVVLMGEGTTLIGDPSGKDASRAMLSKQDIANNMQGIKNTLSNFIDFTNTSKAIMLSNANWLTEFNYLNFLRDYGTHFTINRMLSFESVANRLSREQPLTFLEFNYLLLQAVDFLYLNKNHNVSIQMGGSDQWGNIINGVELIRKTSGKEAFAITTPLLTKADGSKMGKTASGALWLNQDMLSSWDLYQYFRNTEDSVVIKYLKMLTLLPIAEINKLATLQGKEINEAKKILAFEIVKLCHGINQANQCNTIATNTFENKVLDQNLPSINVSMQNLQNGLAILPILVNNNLCASNSEAKKLIASNGVKINDVSINNHLHVLTPTDIANNVIKISVGKKKHVLLKIN